MLLFELFDDILKWEYDNDSYSDVANFTFSTKEGVEYSVSLTLHAEEPMEVWDVEFTNHTVDRDDRHQVTGSGNPLQVFATVLDIVTQFASKRKECVFTFSSSGDTRSSLYERLLQRVLKPPMTYTTNDMSGLSSSGRFFVVGTEENIALYNEYIQDQHDLYQSVNTTLSGD